MNRARDWVMAYFFVGYNYLAHYLVLLVIAVALYPFIHEFAYLLAIAMGVAKEFSDSQKDDNYFDVIAVGYGVMGVVMAHFIIKLFKGLVL
jgi:hypothetical protein